MCRHRHLGKSEMCQSWLVDARFETPSPRVRSKKQPDQTRALNGAPRRLGAKADAEAEAPAGALCVTEHDRSPSSWIWTGWFEQSRRIECRRRPLIDVEPPVQRGRQWIINRFAAAFPVTATAETACPPPDGSEAKTGTTIDGAHGPRREPLVGAVNGAVVFQKGHPRRLMVETKQHAFASRGRPSGGFQ
jgi:hypothetical protein